MTRFTALLVLFAIVVIVGLWWLARDHRSYAEQMRDAGCQDLETLPPGPTPTPLPVVDFIC